ncbi:hypothetical protein DFH27DRAFT_14527 [Peziza echinospora]|nr:hypothetical protein DFH27DRAFT_14527 [Peziza echinospora]
MCTADWPNVRGVFLVLSTPLTHGNDDGENVRNQIWREVGTTEINTNCDCNLSELHPAHLPTLRRRGWARDYFPHTLDLPEATLSQQSQLQLSFACERLAIGRRLVAKPTSYPTRAGRGADSSTDKGIRKLKLTSSHTISRFLELRGFFFSVHFGRKSARAEAFEGSEACNEKYLSGPLRGANGCEARCCHFGKSRVRESSWRFGDWRYKRFGTGTGLGYLGRSWSCWGYERRLL